MECAHGHVGNDYPITLDAHRVKSVRAGEGECNGWNRDAREKNVFLASSSSRRI